MWCISGQWFPITAATSSIRLHQASQPTSLSRPVPVHPRHTRSYRSQSFKSRSIGPSMCQRGAPFDGPNGHCGSKLSLSCDGAPGASGITAHRPGWNRRCSSHSKYGVQSSRMNHNSPRFMAACHSENAPLSKHDRRADGLDYLHIVRPPETNAECASWTNGLQGRTRRHRRAVVDDRRGHASTARGRPRAVIGDRSPCSPHPRPTRPSSSRLTKSSQ